ncbi:hypothetical protein KJE20_00937 [Pyrenophora tritici-repentis]|uniref:Uncharacterized protein n=1 Tax=Pyrenophora tritici-repentis TaxID=45151 RepID=A0A2W1ERS7_9PLEO|nr:hypothetical protein Ptr86124_000904 [Pyrenophora tritici-repentis]KAI1687760.1 hypothetical protein KJE20_00937 [Pyrenophora tritici-repentis]PWO23341.1 LSM1, Small nuclear ribonucleoprotein (snRNP) [Pyrenophora tritici-repentis]
MFTEEQERMVHQLAAEYMRSLSIVVNANSTRDNNVAPPPANVMAQAEAVP